MIEGDADSTPHLYQVEFYEATFITAIRKWIALEHICVELLFVLFIFLLVRGEYYGGI
jgi:hypothetical protein